MGESIYLTFKSDEKGYYDRQCPSPECKYRFKVYMQDWKDKFKDEAVYCPLCGYADTSDNWETEEQEKAINDTIKSYANYLIDKTIGKAFRDLERSTRNNKFIKVTYTPKRPISFINNPIGSSEEWETELECEKCGAKYSVIGAAYFCPCCGNNSAIKSFKNSLISIRKMLDSYQDMSVMLKEKFDEDTAVSMMRKILENSLGDIISAFQKFACTKYEELSGTQGRNNDFQIVEKGSKKFEEVTGKSYGEWLNNDELKQLNILFQRRHIIEHNDGIVDQHYLDKSGDTGYSLGQRIVVKISEAYLLLNLIDKLGEGLLSL